jgi:hypothetical protein
MRANLLSRMVAAVFGMGLFGAFASTSADAAYVVIFEEVGPDVEVVGGDMTSDNAFVFAQGAADLTGAPALAPIDVYKGVTGPLSLGPGSSSIVATSGSGGLVGVFGNDLEVVVPRGYVSGTLLSDESLYANYSFASLGLTLSVYVYKWGSGDTADSLTIVVGEVPEPSTWALMLLGFAGLGYLGHRASRSGVTTAA